MRKLITGWLLGVWGLASLGAATPPLLEAAVQKLSDNYGRWAYTQTVVEKNEKGKVLNEAVVRFDPSKPYAEQYEPLKIDGQPPTAGDLKTYRKRGEKRGESLAKAENEGTSPTRRTLGELMELTEATLVSEDAATATFEVPLKKANNDRLPPHKFRVTACVDKAAGALRWVDVTLREPLRQALIFKLKSGEGRLEFATMDRVDGSVLTTIEGSGSGSIVFVRIGRSYRISRENFVRVKPFDERFEVKMGPLKSIDF